jgi:KDO2-lipid IV(A) lauroyltransferase
MRPRTDRQRTFRLRDLPLWLAIAIAWLLVRLPLPLLLRIGIGIGWLGDRVAGSRAHIADVNLALCFPELDVRARRALRRRTFRAYGIALVETAIAWLRPVTALSRRTQIDGLEHVRAAQARGHGVLLLGAHFSTLDLAGTLLATALRLDITYRRNRNPAIEWLMHQGRARCYDRVHERDDVRAAIRSLREGRVLWYAADQDYGRRHSVFAPFFGVPAATITAATRIAAAGGAEVLFFSHFRTESPWAWQLSIQPLPAGYPSGETVQDATLLNAHIEAQVRRDPAQYLWLHRRFKTRPAGEARPY